MLADYFGLYSADGTKSIEIQKSDEDTCVNVRIVNVDDGKEIAYVDVNVDSLAEILKHFITIPE